MNNENDAVDRRAFLETMTTGALVGAASAATGCGGWLGQQADAERVDPDSIELFRQRFDGGLLALEGVDLLTPAFRATPLPQSEKARELAAKGNPLAQRALRSMHVAGVWGDLNDAERQHPEVQRRIAAFAPEMDQTVVDLRNLLASVPRARQKEMRAIIAKHDTAMQVAEALDTEARRHGLSLGSRTKLRRVAKEVGSRLARQPMELLLGDYVGKVDRIAARNGYELVAQTNAAAAVTSRLFWSSDGTETGQNEPVAYEPTAAPEEARRGPHPGVPVMIVGGVMIGVGAVVFGVGALLSGSGSTGLVTMTLGALVAVVGLIVLIVGGIIALASSG